MDLGSIAGRMGTITVIITAFPFVLIAAYLVWRALSSQRQVRATQSWPAVEGRILSSEVETRRTRNAQGHTTIAHYPAVSYEYVVEGKRYMNNVIHPGQAVGLGFRGAVEKKVARYPVGQAVQVYYNPQNPAESTLETTSSGAHRVLWLVVAFIVLMLICTLTFTFGMLRFVDGILGPLG